MDRNEYAQVVFPKSVYRRPNVSVLWASSDSEENYDPVDNIYNKDEIVYNYNAYGLRCDDLDLSTTNLFLGCSGTEGVGVKLEETWSYKLNTMLGEENYVSFALAAHGFHLQVNILYWYYKYFNNKPKNIFILSPSFSRMTLKLGRNNGSFSYIPGHCGNEFPVDIDALCGDQNFEDYMTMHSLQKLDLIAKHWNSNVYFSMWSPDDRSLEMVSNYGLNILEYPKFPIKSDGLTDHPDLARDKMHPGPKTHSIIADYFHKQVTGLNNGN